MEKLIIENHTDMSMEDVLNYIGHAVRSRNIKGLQKKTIWGGDIAIYATKNKHSDRLVVKKEKR